ncbi:hypothetical protein F5Y10DRAFT_237978 [Nemania abortiva]|nr:hypothetical protein F5Y10DRAFT_237978 [Nemania abortiva]
MPPVTRRAAKAQINSSQEEPTISTPDSVSASKKEILFEEPIALRSKQENPKDANNGEDQEEIAEGAEEATPKRKKLEVRIRDDNVTSKKTSIEVQIPSSAIKTPRSRSSPVPDSQDSNTSSENSQTFEPLSASKQLEEEATQKLASRARRVEAGLETTPLPKAAKSKSVPQPIESEAETKQTPQRKAAKSTHVVFGDDDDVDKFVAAAAEKERDAPAANASDADKDEEEDSDDEAPEAVSTAAAAKETLRSARAAIEAAEKLAASTKRKRQARDNLLKQQAQKRKREEPSKSEKKGDSSEDDEGEDEEEEQRNTASKRQRRTRDLPDTLPAEFLTDSSEDEDDETALKKMVKRPKKITFETAMQALDAKGRGPRDEVVGSTRYRVLADQGDQRLAPKANKNSRRVKDDLLRRGRTRVAVNKKRGFFVK